MAVNRAEASSSGTSCFVAWYLSMAWRLGLLFKQCYSDVGLEEILLNMINADFILKFLSGVQAMLKIKI